MDRTKNKTTKNKIKMHIADSIFRCSTWSAVHGLWHAKDFDSSMYMYHLTHISSFGAFFPPPVPECANYVCHIIDNAYIFQQPDLTASFGGPHYTSEELELSNRMIDLWGQFAANGEPGSAGKQTKKKKHSFFCSFLLKYYTHRPLSYIYRGS